MQLKDLPDYLQPGRPGVECVEIPFPKPDSGALGAEHDRLFSLIRQDGATKAELRTA